MQQRTAEWMAARLGKITASRFADVLTQPRAKADKAAGLMSKTATAYMLDLVAEKVTGKTQGPPIMPDMQWGINHEPQARRWYEKITGRTVTEVGFIEHPTEALVGCSPDGLVGDDGGIEIKCPANTRIHLECALSGHAAHDAQIQGAMWVTGRDWWDFITYDPRIPDLALACPIVRVDRDEAFIDRLESALRKFRDRLEETLQKLTEKEGNQ